MRAVLIEDFGVRPVVTDVCEPRPPAGGVVLKVVSTGLCRSDWHGWMGHDPSITLPHVPGHEVAGTIAALGSEVSGWQLGERVTVPFICACGVCERCRAGEQQVCENQQQPGFSYWGSFADYVAVPHAEVNLVRLPDELGFDAASGLGCRFATAYRGVTQVGQLVSGEWLAVFGCGGVGLSAVMIAAAVGAQVIAVDVNPDALAMAAQHGASHTLSMDKSISRQIREITGGGAHVTVDALGSADLVQAALQSLRPRGRHVQIGLLPGEISLKLEELLGRELQWLGSHGMAARHYPEMLARIASGELSPDKLVTRQIGLDEVPAALLALSAASPTGITIIRP